MTRISDHFDDVRDRLSIAFIALRKSGMLARQNFQCCQGCAWAAISELPAGKNGVVFYHRQDTDRLKRTGSCCLSFGGFDDDERNLTVGRRVAEAMRAVGLRVDWEETAALRIEVSYLPPPPPPPAFLGAGI